MTKEELQQIEEDATEFVEGNTNVIERPTVAGLLSLIAKLKHENLRYQKALERDLSETLYLQDWRQQAEKARTREEADNVRIQVLRQEKEALENALKESYATNTDLHRRVQQVESPFRSEVANLQNLVESLREECHSRRKDYWDLLEKYRASDKKISELREALNKAEVRKAVLREALDTLLSNAQILRINQVQSCAEMGWPVDLCVRCDSAWDNINKAHGQALKATE